MKQFDRDVELLVGPPGSVSGIKIKDLRVSFHVSKSLSEDSNSASIVIHNVSHATRNRIKQLDHVAVLKAGYVSAGGAKTIFIGNITTIIRKVERPEVITEISCRDGYKAMRQAKVSLSYREGASAKEALRQLLDVLGVDTGYLGLSDVPDSRYPNAVAYFGHVTDSLHDVCERLGLEWSIQDETIKILKKKATDKRVVPVVSPQTGLIGSPERIEESRGSQKADTKPGWKVISLLQPSINPGNGVFIESAAIPEKTLFRVESIEHEGDTHGGTFVSTMIVSDL